VPASQTLTIGATLEPPTLDPFDNTAASIPQVLLYNVYETLVKESSNGQLGPLLAQKWDVSADRKQYTFHLNPAATFASGAPVDAQAVVWNIQRIQGDAKLTQALRTQASVIASAKAIDATTVVITLKQPSILWLYDMSSTLGMMVDPTSKADLNTASAGSGPYAVQAHNNGVSVVLVKSPHYWGTPAHFDQVSFLYYTDPNAENAAMLSGQLDIISNLEAPDSMPQFADTSQYTTSVGTTNGEVVLGLNHKNLALAKLDVREALTMAIDRKALLDTVWAGQGVLIGTMDVPTDPWYQDLSGYIPYNPAKAKQMLQAAGYGSGLTLRFVVPNVPYAVKSAQFVQSELRDVGVTVTIQQEDFSRWLSDVLADGNYDLTAVAHVEPRDLGLFADPTYYWHNDDPVFAKLYNEAVAAPPDQATSLMKQAAQRLADQAAAIWLFVLPNIVIAKSDLAGVPANAITLSFDLTTITRR